MRWVRIVTVASLVVGSVGLISCTRMSSLSWNKAMRVQIARYGGYSRKRLQPYFQRAHVPYPPKQLAILVFKRKRVLELYAKHKAEWRFIRSYPVLGASGTVGPKLKEGDRQVPEGIYSVVAMNPRSRYDLSVQIDYPNAFDQEHAELDGRTTLGNNIFIHGKTSSRGCVAVGNAAIREIFPLIYYVGIRNTEVIIAPNDFRLGNPMYGSHRPSWLARLYFRIRNALSAFPLPMRKRQASKAYWMAIKN